MGYSYKPLWNLLTEKGITKTAFREKIGISTSTLAKLSANKPVSTEVLAKICEFFGCRLENIAEYASDMELFMIGIEQAILGWNYTIYIDRWPECTFKLTQNQMQFLAQVSEKHLLQEIIFKCEQKANFEHQPNGGILGATKLRFDPSETKLIINGSFAVVENFMPWLIEESKQI